jgi:hypothetical protein
MQFLHFSVPTPVEVITWIENHRVTVGLTQSLALILLAWLAGAFRLLQALTRKPSVRIVDSASFVFIESVSIEGKENASRAAYVINASLVNSSTERIVLDQFSLSYQTANPFRSFKQRLVRIAFPARPRKRLGSGFKMMGIWFTNFPDEEYALPPALGELEPKDMESGYLLFSSFTWGSWNPLVADDQIRVKLKALLTSGEVLVSTARLRALYEPETAHEFCPGIIEHIAHESTWNHDLSTWNS